MQKLEDMCVLQGVVTYMSPVEVFATRIKIFDRQKVCLIAPSKTLDLLIFTGQWLNWNHAFLILDIRTLEVTLIDFQKGLFQF